VCYRPNGSWGTGKWRQGPKPTAKARKNVSADDLEMIIREAPESVAIVSRLAKRKPSGSWESAQMRNNMRQRIWRF
jgi:hypothetical protein